MKMKVRILSMFLLSCSASTPQDARDGGASSDAGSNAFICLQGPRGNDGSKTTYSCPTQSAFDACTTGNSTGCVPQDKKPGIVAPGAMCNIAFAAGDPGFEFELNDNCAPNSKYVGQGKNDTAKGSFCYVAGKYCTHGCSQNSQCTDVAITAVCATNQVCEKP
jgi:hypothetical protein